MLDRVILQSSTPKILQITDVDPDEILILKSISGLSGPKLNLFTGAFAGDGGYYQGRRADQRNPVFNFKMNPDYHNDVAISDIREMVYRWFLNTSSTGLKVVLDDDRKPDRYFNCFAEDINSEMWDKDQTIQVSTLCVDPYIKSVALTEWYTYPYPDTTLMDYEGSVDTGIDIYLYVQTTTNAVHVSWSQGPINEVMYLYNPAGFVAGKTIEINTISGSRKVQYDGVDVMAMLQAGSKWITLRAADHVGSPNISQLYSGGSAILDGKVKLSSTSYRANWWGI